jgi:hypothetical protein
MKIGRIVLLIFMVICLTGCAGATLQALNGLHQAPTFTTGFARNFSTQKPASGPVMLANTELVNYGKTTEVLGADGKAASLRFRYVHADFCVGVSGTNEQNSNTLAVPTGLCTGIYETVTLGAHYDLRNATTPRESAMATVTIEPFKLDQSPLFKPLWDMLGRLWTSNAQP